MDDFSCLADRSNNFASFLTVPRKFKYSCVGIFHIINLEKSTWKLICSQTTIFNIFHGSVEQACVLKALSANCTRKTVFHVPRNVLRISRPYISLANRKDNDCLTIGC